MTTIGRFLEIWAKNAQIFASEVAHVRWVDACEVPAQWFSSL